MCDSVSSQSVCHPEHSEGETSCPTFVIGHPSGLHSEWIPVDDWQGCSRPQPTCHPDPFDVAQDRRSEGSVPPSTMPWSREILLAGPVSTILPVCPQSALALEGFVLKRNEGWGESEGSFYLNLNLSRSDIQQLILHLLGRQEV